MPIAGILAASVLPAVGLTLGWRAAIALAGLWIIASGVLTLVFYRDPVRPAQERARAESVRASVAHLLRSWDLWTVSLMAILFVIAQQAMIAYIPLYFKEVVLRSAVPDHARRVVAAGGFLALCQVGGIGGRIFWGVVSDRVFRGRRRVVLAIAGALSAVLSVPIGSLQPDTPLWALSLLMFTYGITAIGWNGVYHALMGETAGATYAATGVALSMSLTQVATVGGPPLFGIVVDLAGGYRPAWLMLTACYIGAVAIALWTARGEKPIPAGSQPGEEMAGAISSSRR
jgi:predicted MFS family arabinose efflux permease